MRTLVSAALAATVLSLAHGARAQSFNVLYNLAGQPGNQATQPATASSVPAGLSAGDLKRGPGLGVASGANGFAANGFTTGGLASDDYFSVILSPLSGRTLTLSSLSFSERRSLTGVHDFALRSSLDSFAGDLLQVTVPDDSLTRRHTYSFSGAFSQLLAPVELRLYGYHAESGAGTWRLGVNATSADNPNNLPPDLRIAGILGNKTSAAAPEPGVLPLFLVGLAGLGTACRHRRKALVAKPGANAIMP